MKKIILIIFSFITIGSFAQNIGYFNYGQSGNYSWSNHLVVNAKGELVMAGLLDDKPCFVVANTTGAYSTNRVVANSGELFSASIDASDNIFVAGHNGAIGSQNKLIVKYDATMVKQFSKNYGSGTLRYIINDGTDVVAAGFNNKPCIIKTDASGNLIWYKEYTINGNNADAYVIHKSGSNYYMAGSFDVGGTAESYVLSVNAANGNVNWCKTYVGASLRPHFTGMDISASGIVLCGATAQSSSGNPGNLIVVKIDLSGNVLWTRQINGQYSWYLRNPTTMGNSWGINCAFDQYGAVVVAGETENNYAMMAKLNGNTGTVIWTKRYGNGGGPSVNDDGFHGITISGCTYLASGWMGPTVGGNWDFGLVVTDTSGFAGSSATCGTSITKVNSSPVLTVLNGTVTNVNLSTATNYAGTNTTAGMSSNAICASASAYTISANSATICAGSSTTLSVNSGALSYSWTASNPGTFVGSNTTHSVVVNPTVTTTYSCYVGGTSGCLAMLKSTVYVTSGAGPTVTVNSASLNCTNTTATLTATGGGTYTWSGPGIVSGSLTANPVINQGGTYTVIVTGSNGCSTTTTTAVSQNTTAPTAGASNSSTLTCTTRTIGITGTGGGAYAWSGPGIVSGGSTATPSVNLPGTYVVTVTAANGCTATANTSVTQNTTAPTAGASNSSTLTCTTRTIGITGTGGGTYAWSGPGIVSGGSTATPSVNLPGTYVVTVTAANGCTATANTSVTQNTTAPTAGAVNSGSLNCTNTTVTLTASGGGTYAWTGGAITGNTSANPTVNAGGTYSVLVTAANGCTATANTSVTQNTTAPTAGASNSGSLTCTVNSINLTATGGGTYAWSGPGITGATNTATTTANTPGSYVVVVTAANGCTATANTTINQNTTTPTANAGPSQTLTCGSPSVTLTGSASPAGATANWLGGVCGSSSSFTTAACAPGTYTLVATIPASGCTHTSVVTVSSSTNVPQATVNPVTNSITCTNSIVTIGVTPVGSDPLSFAWSGPGTLGSPTNSVTTANMPGVYSVTITNTSSGCDAIYTANVPSNTIAPVANATSSSTITCTNTLVTLNATPTGTNYAYSWSGPGTITNGTSSSPSVDAGGSYVVTVTDNINGCTGTSTVTVISNTTTPSFTLGTAPTLTATCAVPTVTLSGSSSDDPNTIYTWTTPSSGTLTGNPVMVSNPGIYTVSVTNTITGCSTSSALQATVEVVADAGIPVVTLSSNTASITCTNPSPTVAITTTASPVSYSWSPTAGIVPGTETTATPQFTAPGTYSAVVTNTVSGCATSIANNVVTVVDATALPSATLSTSGNSGTITCTNLNVTVTPTVSPSANVTYTWSGTGLASSPNQASATFTAAGVYTLAVTNTLTGCVSSSTNTANTFTVVVDNTAPTGTITVTSSNTVIGCGASNGTVTLNSSTSGANATNINWLPGNLNTPSIDVTSAGTYTLEVVDAVNGCSTTVQYVVTGSTVTPQGVDAGTSANIACGSSTVVLNGVTTSSNVSYTWAGPSATSILTGSNTLNPTVGETGTYTLTVTDNVTGCSSSAVVTVSQSSATASLTANPTTGTSPLDVNFTGGGNGTSFTWDFGNGQTSTDQNPSQTFTTGTYTVSLVVASGTCVATATVEIVVEDGLTLEIPNVFTPNGDNVNDIFTIKSTGVKEIALQIFNRWGEKLYEFSGAKASWDGKVPNGASAPEGTYFFFVKATGFDGKEIEKHGSVNLFR
ncbi:MAG: gliding motility-associated C-terminal domain-containing protein [Bacteroidia bacterium]|nr:gliding motility-associated C-terminal domain-containing protein [Bacteroidia bacterium]